MLSLTAIDPVGLEVGRLAVAAEVGAVNFDIAVRLILA
jgi:hypothetical protein